MRARLTAGNRTGPQVTALCGLGGSGKTSAAVEYAHRHIAEFAVIWQLAAEDPTAMADEFGVLAAQLGVRDLLDAGRLFGPGSARARSSPRSAAGTSTLTANPRTTKRITRITSHIGPEHHKAPSTPPQIRDKLPRALTSRHWG